MSWRVIASHRLSWPCQAASFCVFGLRWSRSQEKGWRMCLRWFISSLKFHNLYRDGAHSEKFIDPFYNTCWFNLSNMITSVFIPFRWYEFIMQEHLTKLHIIITLISVSCYTVSEYKYVILKTPAGQVPKEFKLSLHKIQQSYLQQNAKLPSYCLSI